MKYIKLEPVTTIEGDPFRVRPTDTPEKPANSTDLVDLVKIILWNIPQDKVTMKEAEFAMRFHIRSTEVTNGVIAMDDEEYPWIMSMVEEYGPKIYLLNAAKIKRALENTIDEKAVKALKKEPKEE